MTKYKVVDNISGKTITVEGDTPPTEEELPQIFQDAKVFLPKDKEEHRDSLLSKAMNTIKDMSSFLVKKTNVPIDKKEESDVTSVKSEPKQESNIYKTAGERIGKFLDVDKVKVPSVKKVVETAKDVAHISKRVIESPIENIARMYEDKARPIAEKSVPYLTTLGKATITATGGAVPNVLTPKVWKYGEEEGMKLKEKMLLENERLMQSGKLYKSITGNEPIDKSKPILQTAGEVMKSPKKFIDLNLELGIRGPLKLAEKAQEAFIKYVVPLTPTETIGAVLTAREVLSKTPNAISRLNKIAEESPEELTKEIHNILRGGTQERVLLPAPKKTLTATGSVVEPYSPTRKYDDVFDLVGEKVGAKDIKQGVMLGETRSIQSGYINPNVVETPFVRTRAKDYEEAILFNQQKTKEAEQALKASEDFSKMTKELETSKELKQTIPSLPSVPSKKEVLKNNLIRSGETYFNKQGEAGKELGRRAKNMIMDRDIYEGSMKEKFMNELIKTSKSDRETIFMFLDKGQIPEGMSPKAIELAKKIKSVLDEQGKMLEGMDIKVYTSKGSRPFYARKNFFPHEPDYDVLKTAEGRKSEIEHLISSGQVDTPEEANKVVDAVVNRRSPILTAEDMDTFGLMGIKKYAGLERARAFDFTNIVKDPVVAFDRHFSRIARRLAEIKHLGQNHEIANSLLSKMANEGYDYKTGQQIINRLTMKEDVNFDLDQALSNIRAFQATTKLGLAGIKNAPQGFVNTFIKYNLSSAIKGVKSLMTKEGWKNARMSGTIGNQALNDFIDNVVGVSADRPGILNKIARGTLKATGYRFTEEANRVLATNAGRAFLKDDLLPKLLKNPNDEKIRMAFRSLDINPDDVVKAGNISENDLIKAGWNAVRNTQFSNDALALPYMWTSPAGKVVFQFKTFGFNQAKFLKNALKEHPVSTTTKTAIAAGMIGVPVYEVDRMLRGKEREEKDTILNELINGFITIGTATILGDMFSSSKFGKQGAYGFLGGPTMADMADAIITPHKIAKDKSVRPLAKQIFRRIPVIGQIFTNRIFNEKK